MPRIRSDHEPFWLDGQQIIVPHHPCHLLAIHLHASAVEFGSDPPAAVTTAMFQSDLLNQRSHFRLFLSRFALSQRAVETPATDRNQLTHVLDTQSALQRHQLPRCVRRCFLARTAAELASLLYFLQGTLQKIHLHGLLGQQPLQLVDLLAISRLMRVRPRPFFSWLKVIELGAPLVETSPGHTEFLSQFIHARTTLHTLYSRALKLPGIALPSLHECFLSRRVCPSLLCQFKGSLQFWGRWLRQAELSGPRD